MLLSRIILYYVRQFVNFVCDIFSNNCNKELFILEIIRIQFQMMYNVPVLMYSKNHIFNREIVSEILSTTSNGEKLVVFMKHCFKKNINLYVHNVILLP